MAEGFPSSGSTFYRDTYDTLFTIYWETIDHDGIELLDFTTITKTPYVWGEMDEGTVQNKQVFRRGICMTQRQIFSPNEDGYEIIAEGGTSNICIFQTTFNCDNAPVDIFRHHTDQIICDPVEAPMACGPRFSDPENINDDLVSFQAVAEDGQTSTVPGTQPFQFVDVWGNDEELESVCDPSEIESTALMAYCNLSLPELGDLSLCALARLPLCD